MGVMMDPADGSKAIADGMPDLTRASNISREKVVGIGVALSGHVDHAQGICLHSNLLGWHNVPIAKIVERVTQMPTYIDNDAHAVPLGQKLFGLARALKSFLAIMLGTHIGGATRIPGRMHRAPAA